MWDTCYPWMSQAGCTNFGNTGKEDEWYLPSQVKVAGGLLQLTARRAPTAGLNNAGSPKTYSCRSGMVTTHPGIRFKYGYIQVTAKIPTNAGLWPALWLAASSYQWPPEMDLIEAWGSRPGFYAASYFHFKTANGPKYTKATITPATDASGWHVFALDWTKTSLTWLLDGKVIMTDDHHIPHQSMYLIADLAEAVTQAQPNVTPGQCAGTMLISSVKVWKQ